MHDNPLYIPVGIPGCGKSSFANQLLPGIRTVSTDAIRRELFGALKVAHDPEAREANNDRVFALYHGELALALEYGHGVYADATNLTVEARERLRSIAVTRNAPIHLILFKNTAQAIERNGRRDLDSAVPWEVQKQMLVKYFDTLESLYNGESKYYTTVTEIASFG